jgi:hypothetical protein
MSGERLTVGSAQIAAQDRKSIRALFRGVYSMHHTRRFEWLKRKIESLGKREISVLELGCNDARSLSYIPIPVTRYVGLDAGWQSGWRDGKAVGLEAARHRYRHDANFEIRQSTNCNDLQEIRGKFDVAIVLETFEYLDPARIEEYIKALSLKLNDGGMILSTMPNEKGVPLIVKALGSRLSGVPRSGYTARQFWDAIKGDLDKVPRASRGRRGFDYEKTAELVGRYFSEVRLDAVEPANAPLWLSLNVGLTAQKAAGTASVSEEPSREFLCAKAGQ